MYFFIEGEKKPTWKPQLTYSNEPNKTYDPHQELQLGEKCKICID